MTAPKGGHLSEKSGGVLLSQGVYPQVPSALTSLTSVFEMGTGVASSLSPPETGCVPQRGTAILNICVEVALEKSIASTSKYPSPRPISTGLLNALLHLHIRPINVVVYHRPYPVNPVGEPIFERVSRLDAFSGYPFRRSPTSHAPGGTTGTRELRPSRSSRTRDSLRQFSYDYRG